MAPSAHTSPRRRKSFSRLEQTAQNRPLDVPDLIALQVDSFTWFLEGGIREAIDEISPIEDYTGTLAVEFGEYEFEPPKDSLRECRETDKTYERPLFMNVRFINKATGEIREQRVFMGAFPMMTDAGTFIINGTERVVVTQLVRSPGAYIMEPKDRDKQVFTANLMPSRGSWLELEIDKKGQVFARIDRKRKLPVTTLLRALPLEDPTTGERLRHPLTGEPLDTTTDDGIRALFTDPATGRTNLFIDFTIDKDPVKTHEQALVEVFKKQRPGEPPTLENSRALLRALFFDPKRYDLTRVGRYKLNSRLGLDVDPEVRVLTGRDLVELVRRLVNLPLNLVPDPTVAEFVEWCLANSVRLISIIDRVDTGRNNTAGEIARIHRLFVDAQEESELAKERSTDNIQFLREHGVPWGYPSSGYKRVGEGLDARYVKDTEAPNIVQIIQWRIEGLSYRACWRRANAEGLQHIPDVGPVVAASIVNFFAEPHNRDVIARILSALAAPSAPFSCSGVARLKPASSGDISKVLIWPPLSSAT